jgi:hypothetical protein
LEEGNIQSEIGKRHRFDAGTKPANVNPAFNLYVLDGIIENTMHLSPVLDIIIKFFLILAFV